MTDANLTEAEAAQRARVEQLQRKRANGGAGAGAARSTPAASGTLDTPTVATARRRHRPATGSKIAVAGFGMTTMFGLVGAMALAQHPSSTTPPAPVSVPPAQVVVVIHQDGTATQAVQAGQPAGVAPVAQSPTPIALTATPVVHQAPAAAAPVAKTSGSR